MLTQGQLETLVGFVICMAISGAIIYIGYLVDKLEQAWHDRHFHHKKKDKYL